jgi:hypothetical protein
MILDILRDGERSVGDLAGELGCAMANASQHLAVLRSAGLVATRRSGTTILYNLAEPELVEACDVVHRIVSRGWPADQPAPPQVIRPLWPQLSSPSSNIRRQPHGQLPIAQGNVYRRNAPGHRLLDANVRLVQPGQDIPQEPGSPVPGR